MVESREVEKTILEEVYESSTSLVSSFIDKQSIIETVADELDIDESEVRYELDVLVEDGFLKLDGATLQMGWRGVERYDELGGRTQLDEDLQEEILELLLAAKKDDPRHSFISKEELIEELGEAEEKVTENVWIQREVGNVELRQSLGSDYDAVAITGLGRRAID